MRQPIPFGKYVLLERISVGGMAEVFKAKAFGVEGFEKILAIKRILPSMAEDADFIEMFIDEAKICGQLNHANICQIFELGRVDDSHFIAMEYVWGKDVLQIQNRFRKLRQTPRPEMAAFIAAKLCEGLDYAHKKKDAAGRPLGIIHRDISPQNILISYDGDLKIIDFGIAKAASRSSKTQAGVLKGKFGYMSPEQVRGLPLDRRSDIFAIGTILYELLTSDRLFMGESDFETLEKVRNVAVAPISTVNKNVPPELEAIIHKALARDADERYQWAAEMQEALQAFLVPREPVFTVKQLTSWMREQFAVEMKREQQVLDEQRKIGREVLQPGAGPAVIPEPTPPGTALPQVGNGVPGVALPSSERETEPFPKVEPFPAGGTNILEGTELADMVLSAELSSPSAPSEEEFAAEKTTVAQPSFALGAAPLTEQSTQILNDNGVVAAAVAAVGESRPTGAAGETHARNAPVAELPAQPTVILEGGTGATLMPLLAQTASPYAPTLLPQPSPVALGHNNGAVRLGTNTGSVRVPSLPRPPSGANVVAPPPYTHAPRSTLWKDIAIGIGVAIAVVAGVLGARALLSRNAHGTLVVMVNAAHAADVFVDGTLRGHVDPGAPLTVRELPSGAHNVTVRSGDGAELRQQVLLVANDVSVLTAALKAPAPADPGTGHVTLKIATEGAQVWVDGAQLADGAWREPIPLRADVPHEIRVTKPMREDVKLPLTLKAGESVTREVELVPAYGKIVVHTEPPGAEVSVNGKHAGLTPATVSDVDPGKPARVSVRLHGYATVIKYVGFEHGLEQTLELKLYGEHEKPPTPLVEAAKPAAATAHEEPKTAAAAAAGGDGWLIANSQPWAKVFVDGKDTGKTTPIPSRSRIALKPGKHVVTFVANGKKYNVDVVIKPAEETKVVKQLTDGP